MTLLCKFVMSSRKDACKSQRHVSFSDWQFKWHLKNASSSPSSREVKLNYIFEWQFTSSVDWINHNKNVDRLIIFLNTITSGKNCIFTFITLCDTIFMKLMIITQHILGRFMWYCSSKYIFSLTGEDWSAWSSWYQWNPCEYIQPNFLIRNFYFQVYRSVFMCFGFQKHKIVIFDSCLWPTLLIEFPTKDIPFHLQGFRPEYLKLHICYFANK